MPAYNFQPHFEHAIVSGAKRQTIRPRRSRPTKAGDNFTATVHGRTKMCRVILRSRVKNVMRCIVHTQCLQIAHTFITDPPALDAFARADGFAGWAAMRDWFDRRYGLPFVGECVVWQFPAASDGGVQPANVAGSVAHQKSLRPPRPLC